MTSIKYEEFFYNGSDYYRVVFNNGTIGLYNYGRSRASKDTKYAHKFPTATPTPASSIDNLNGDNYKNPRPFGARGAIGFAAADVAANSNAGIYLAPIAYGDRDS